MAKKKLSKTLTDTLNNINKKFPGAISSVSEVKEELKIKFLKTPSYEVNYALGGGLGIGKIIEFYGHASSGKTSLALEIIAKNQKEDEDFMVAWMETEGSVDPAYMETFGIDLDRVFLIEQSDILTAEKCMEALRSIASSGEFDLIVLNSVAGLTPSKEVTDDLDKSNIALTARLLSRFLRITTSILAKNKTTMIFINQVRQKLGTHIVTNTTTGGMAIPFFCTQRMEMRKGKIEASDAMDTDAGIKINCKVTKNRLSKGNPIKTCSYLAEFGKGIDSVAELGSVLVKCGILTKGGAWIKYLDKNGELLKVDSKNGFVDAKWNGAKALSLFLKENPATFTFFEKLLEEHLNFNAVSISEIEKEESEITSIDDIFEEQDNLYQLYEVAAEDGKQK